MSENHEPIPEGGDRRDHRKLFRFDPTISTGTMVHMLTIVLMFTAAFATYQSDKATMRLEIEQIKASQAADKGSTKEVVTELKADFRDLQRSLTEMNMKLTTISAELRRPPPAEARERGR